MLNLRNVFLFLLVCWFSVNGPIESVPAFQFQQNQANFVQQRYKKQSFRIPMRDGKTLHTTIYAPRDTSKQYPILLKRTPYSVRPYDDNLYPGRIGPSKYMESDGYIFVHQDVR